MKDLEQILAIARDVGWGASYLLRSYYNGEINDGNLEIHNKKDGPVTVADIAVNNYILDRLKTNLGNQDFAYISEETYDLQRAGQSSQPWVWIIDPLDGTRDFIERTGEYAIHIALVKDGRPVLAVVAWPEVEKLYYATLGSGTFVETRDGKVTPLQVSERQVLEDLTLVVSRTHRDRRFNHLLQHLPCRNQHHVGSVGCKIATIVEQRADILYFLIWQVCPQRLGFSRPRVNTDRSWWTFHPF